MNTKKVLAIFILNCFLFTFVCSEPLHAVLDLRAENAAAARFRNPAGDLLVPQSFGRITDGRSFGGRQVVINIQDLHCHPEVQRNIANILGMLDREYGLTNVFVEGGYGDIDTSRLCNIADRRLKKELIENLVSQGKLTGTEYYSISAGKPHLLKGLEDEAVHKANIVRLGKILDRQEHFTAKLKELDKDLAFMKARYFSPGNRIFDRLVEKHKEGGITTAKYYRLLNGYIDKINENPARYHNIFAVSRGDYPNLQAFLETSDLAKHLQYRKLAAELQQCLQLLKARLPYSEYSALADRTDNFSKLDVLALSLAQMERDHRLDLGAEFPELQRFVVCTDKSGRINPIQLLQEEKRLVGAIRLGLSENLSELEVSFLSDFLQYFQDYLLNRITADDYAYFTGRFAAFRATWGKYAFKDRVADLAADFPLLDEFYRVNCERNGISLKNMEALSALAPAAGETKAEPALPVSRELLKGAEIVVVVTGGFHTEGLKALFEQQKISYLTITPNVTGDTQFSSEVYTELAKFQAGILEKGLPGTGYVPAPIPANTLALALATQLSSKALFDLAIEAVNKQLQAVGPEQRKALLDKIADSIGVAYSEKDGIVTFDNRAQIRLMDDGGHLRAVGVKPGESLSGSMQAALDGLAGAGEFAAAAGRAMAGNADALITLLARTAAEHDLLRDNNALILDILDDPALQKKDVIDGVAAEILARFPEELQKAGADYELGKERLAAAVAQQDDWLQTVLALELFLGRGEHRPGAAPADTKKDGSKKTVRLGDKFSVLLLSLVALAGFGGENRPEESLDPIAAHDAAAVKENAAGSRFNLGLAAIWAAATVTAFAYGGAILGVLYAVTLMLPIYGMAMAYEILFTSAGTRESASVGVIPKTMPENAEWPTVTIEVPIFNEPWPVIEKTLRYAVEARDRYNDKAGPGKANIIVSDDGLSMFTDNKIDRLWKRYKERQELTPDEQNAMNRMLYAQEHDITIVTRPKNGTEFGRGKEKWKFVYRGAFKKGGAINHVLVLADRIAEARENGAKSYEEALRLARAPDRNIENGNPVFSHTYVQGELRVGDFLLILDKDSITPRNSLVTVMPEFVNDPALAYAQVMSTVVNKDETLVSRIHSITTDYRWLHLGPIQAEKGYPRFLGHNGVLRKSAVKQAGYWSEYYAVEDVALSMRLNRMKDPVSGRQYYGRFMNYRQPEFESLLAMEEQELYALAEKIEKEKQVGISERVNAPAAEALALDQEEMVRKAMSLGVDRRTIADAVDRAVSRDELRRIALAVLLYEEATLRFGHLVAGSPQVLVFQYNKYSFAMMQLFVHPLKEWRKKGVLDKNYRQFLSDPAIPWQNKFDLTFWMLEFTVPIVMVANLFVALALVFTGAHFAYVGAALIPLAFDLLMREPGIVAGAIKTRRAKAFAKVGIQHALFTVGLATHLAFGPARFLLSLRDTTFGSTPVVQKKSLAVALSEIRGNMKAQFASIGVYLTLLGSGVLLGRFGYLPVDPSGYFALGITVLLAMTAVVVPFVFDTNVARSVLRLPGRRGDERRDNEKKPASVHPAGVPQLDSDAALHDAAAAKDSADGSRFYQRVFAAWGVAAVIAIAYAGPFLGAYYALLMGFFPVYGLAMAYQILFTSAGERDSASVSVTPKTMPENVEWPTVTIDIPIFTEPWETVKRTLEYAIEARDRYNQVAGSAKANIVLNDDGLNVLADNKIEELLRRDNDREELTAAEKEAIARITFAREHDIVIVARPRNGTDYGWWKYEHRGTFKKAGGVNHTMLFADRIDNALKGGAKDYAEALRQARASDENVAEGKPIFENTYVQGELSVGEFLLMLDKDSVTPRHSIVSTIPEFMRDPALVFAQNKMRIVNGDKTLVAKMNEVAMGIWWNHTVPIQAEKSFVRSFGHNMFLRKSAVQEAGYWSEHYAMEDVALTIKLSGMKDPGSGRQYYGKYIKYKQLTFESLLAMNEKELRAAVEKIEKERQVKLTDRIQAAALESLADDRQKMTDKAVVLGIARPVITGALDSAVSRDDIRRIALAVLLYEEATLEFGEEVAESPAALIGQHTRYSFALFQLLANPVKEWRRKGVLDEQYRRFLSDPDIPWQNKYDLTAWLFGLFMPVIMVASLFVSLAMVFTGVHVSYATGMVLVPLIFDILLREPPILAAAIKAHETKAYIKGFIVHMVYYAGTITHFSLGTVRYLLSLKDTAFGATPVGERKTLTVVLGEIRGELKTEFNGIKAYLTLLGSGLLLDHFGYLNIDPSGYTALGIGLFLAIAAILVPFVYDTNVVRSIMRDRSDDTRSGGNRTVAHIVTYDALGKMAGRYAGTAEFTHVFFTDMPQRRTGGTKTTLSYKVSIPYEGRMKRVDTYAELRDGALVIYMDLPTAGIETGAEAALRQGAAQLAGYLGGTDNMPAAKNASAGIRKLYRKNGRAYDVNGSLKPLLVVDHMNDLTAVKHAFSDAGINRQFFVSGSELETAAADRLDPAVKEILIRQNAWSVTMGENKILKIDSGDFDEISDALDVFKAAGNGQMSIDWDAVEAQLRKGKVTRQEFSEQLAAARRSGVAVYADYRVPAHADSDKVKALFDLGFQGVSLEWDELKTADEQKAARDLVDALKGYPVLSVKGIASDVPLAQVKLTDVNENTVFGENDVIDVEIPDGLSLEEIRDHMQYLPLKNTIIFHSRDIAQLIKADKNIVEQKGFASLLHMLGNFGRQEIKTAEQARRLGFNWNITGLKLLEGEAGRRQIEALSSGNLEGTGIAADSALAEQAAEFLAADPDRTLSTAFLNAIAEKLLMRELVADAFRKNLLPLKDGEFPAELTNPLYREILGTAAMRRFKMSRAEREADEAAVYTMGTPTLESINSFLLGQYNSIRSGQAKPGSVAIVITIILQDLIAERKLKKINMEKAPFDANAFKRMLAAA